MEEDKKLKNEDTKQTRPNGAYRSLMTEAGFVCFDSILPVKLTEKDMEELHEAYDKIWRRAVNRRKR